MPNGPADLPPPAATGFAQPPEGRFNPLLAGGLGLAAGYYLVNRYSWMKKPYTVKKGGRHSRPQPGMLLTKLSLGVNNLLIPAQGEFGKKQLGTGMSLTFFLRCTTSFVVKQYLFLYYKISSVTLKN